MVREVDSTAQRANSTTGDTGAIGAAKATANGAGVGGSERWGDDKSLKRIPNSNQRVKAWLDIANAAPDGPMVYLNNARNLYHLDRYDDNLAAAERYQEALEGNFSHYEPLSQEDLIVGRGIVKKMQQAFGNKGVGSKDKNFFVTDWGLTGARHRNEGGSYSDPNEWPESNEE